MDSLLKNLVFWALLVVVLVGICVGAWFLREKSKSRLYQTLLAAFVIICFGVAGIGLQTFARKTNDDLGIPSGDAPAGAASTVTVTAQPGAGG